MDNFVNSGEEKYPLNPEARKPKIKFNADLTQAVLESIKDKLDFAKHVADYDGNVLAMVIDDLDSLDKDRFYGTVLNKETLRKLEKANCLLDIINTNSCVNIQRFTEASPRCDSGIVAFHAVHGIASLQGVVFKAFRELVNCADEFLILPRSETETRIVFSFDDLWAESREMTDEELEEENDISDEDYEEEETDFE